MYFKHYFAIFNQMYLSKQVLYFVLGICLDLLIRNMHSLQEQVLYYISGIFGKKIGKLQCFYQSN